MKLIALLPMTNAEWILSLYLPSVIPVVDEIVATDDDSTDRSRELVERAGGYVVDSAERAFCRLGRAFDL